MALPRMRTAEAVLEEIKRNDPESAVTLRFVRRLINSGDVPVVVVGRKKLVNVDAILELLSAGYTPAPPAPQLGVIRRVAI